MGFLLKRDFSLGYQPSVDQRNGPPNALLRMDNLTLDEQGALALRQGSSVISGPTSLGTEVRVLFTTTIDGQRIRYAQVDDGIFASVDAGVYTQIQGAYPGSGDIAFAAQLGQVFTARSTQKFKHDGLNTRQWGITTPTAVPSIEATESNVLDISTFNDGESPAWEATEGSVDGDVGRDELANGARVLTPSSETGRGTIERVYAAETDLFNYPDGEAGAEEDLFEFYVWISDPSNLDVLTLSIDVNGDDPSTAARFSDDTYYHDFTFDDAVEVKFDDAKLLDDRYDVEGFGRDDVFDRREKQRIPYLTGRVRRDQVNPTLNSGWAKFSLPRSRFHRSGNTPGKNWTTVKAIQFTALYRISESVLPGVVKLDQMRFIGGEDHTLNGRYKVRCVLFADYGTHVVRSAPTDFSEEVELKANGLDVSLAIQGLFDQHVTGGVNDPTVGVEAYLMGGTMDGFYLAATRNQQDGTANFTITDSERTCLIRNTRLVTDNQEPPDDIIAAEPHRQRMIVLTRTELRISQLANPESFPISLTFPVGNRSFSAYWMQRSGDDIIVGTSIDGFVLEGIGQEFPDGTTDFRLRALGWPEPPVSEAAASGSGMLAYLASDGPRVVRGAVGGSLRANLDILYQGVTRYSVSPPNIGSAVGRFRFAIWGTRLYAIVPEGSDVSGSRTLHIYDLRRERWDRRTYPRLFMSLYREPDGKIVAGDDTGSIYQLDVNKPSTLSTDEVVSGGAIESQGIPYVAWFPFDDDQKPFIRKEGFDLRAEVESLDDITLVMLADGNTSLVYDSVTIPGSSDSPYFHPISGAVTADAPITLQFRLSGTSRLFNLKSLGLAYRERPLPRVAWDTGFIDLGVEVPWIRRLMVKARSAADITANIYFEGAAKVDPLTITVTPNVETEYPVPVGRFCRGRQPRITLTCATPFELYWIDVYYHGTGQATEKRRVKVGG